MIVLDPSQWEYIGEGGKHAVFAFRSSTDDGGSGGGDDDEQQLMFHGKLLRISKSDLRQSSSVMMMKRPQPPCPSHNQQKDANTHDFRDGDCPSSLFYIRNIVQPYFEHFVDVPQIITLEWRFVYDLSERTLQRHDRGRPSFGKIPKSRKKDWVLSGDDRTSSSAEPISSTKNLPKAMLMMDYRAIPSTLPSSSSLRPCMTIEIKPKAGYLPISPLIHPFHRIKYTTCRFQLLQTLHLHGKWSKGWTAQTTTVKERKRKQSDFICSEYNPLHFFDHSGSSSIHQRSSIMKLLQCPQNNLRIWYDNIMIVGFNKDDDDDDENNDIPQKHGHDDDDPSAYRQVLNALLSEWEENAVDNIMSSGNENSYHVPNDSTLNLILESIILEVMVSDPAKQLLRRLLDWQKLDVVDVDGAGLVYQRLVDYCHGSHAKAQTLVDTIQPNDLMENPIHDNSLQPQQEQDTTGTTRKSKVLPLFELSPFRCDNLLDESFDILLAFCQEVYDLQEELEVSRPALPNETFMNTKRDIVLDIVKTLPIDACVFILRNWLLSLAMCDVSIYTTLQPLIDDEHLTSQTDGQFITVTFHNGVTRNFVFCLHIIDCDQKPAKKLEGRLEKEAAFRFFV